MAGVIEQFIQGGADCIPDKTYGPGYRCTAELSDGTVLPCVIIRQRQPAIDLAVRRLKEEAKGKGAFARSADPWREMLSHFITTGNRINAYDVKSVTRSRYATPMSLLEKIEGETIMAWTGFVVEMHDGRMFAFGTSFLWEFFDLPPGYEFEDVRSIHNHSYIDTDGHLRSIHEDVDLWSEQRDKCIVYREKPYFICYV